MALRARNASPRGRATLNPQNTCHGPRPGPKLAHWVRAGPRVPRSREHEERPAAGREKNAEGPKNTFICIYEVYTYDVVKKKGKQKKNVNGFAGAHGNRVPNFRVYLRKNGVDV